MSSITRRSALAACATLALPVRPESEVVGEGARPVFVPLTRSPFPEADLEAFNANLLKLHEGRVWVYDHRDNLPTSYEEIDCLPGSYREALLEALPVATVVDLVLERIQRCAEADPYLTEEQRAVIASAPLTLTPAWSEASNEEREAGWPDGGFWERAREAFTVEEWSRVFCSDDAQDLWLYARFLSLRGCVQAVGW